MAVTISCRDLLGSPCDEVVSGETMGEIILEIQEHAMSVHGFTEAQVQAAEMVAIIRGAIRQSARPLHLRTTKLNF